MVTFCSTFEQKVEEDKSIRNTINFLHWINSDSDRHSFRQLLTFLMKNELSLGCR